MNVRIKTNIKFNGSRIEAGTIFTSPLPEGMDEEFLKDTRICDVLEVTTVVDTPKPVPRIIKKASK